MGCNGSEFGAILRYIGLFAAVSALLLLFGSAILSKKLLNRWIDLSTSWLMVIYLALFEAPNLPCKGQAPGQLTWSSKFRSLQFLSWCAGQPTGRSASRNERRARTICWVQSIHYEGFSGEI
jgi:hypothetical protein